MFTIKTEIDTPTSIIHMNSTIHNTWKSMINTLKIIQDFKPENCLQYHLFTRTKCSNNKCNILYKIYSHYYNEISCPSYTCR